MAEPGYRARFAVTVFYDRELLAGSLGAFRGLGLADEALWLAGPAELFEDEASLRRSFAMRQGSLDELVPSHDAGAKPDGAASGFLIGTFWGDGSDCLKGLLSGEIGAILRSHVEKGAAIIAARTESAELQDQCVRELLRYSQHMVYSWECRSKPAKQAPAGGRSPTS